MTEIRNAYRFFLVNLKEKTLGKLGVDRRIILEWILRETGLGSCGLGSPGSEEGPVADSYEHSNKILGPIRGRKFLTS
jgi:hypothetical protein